MCVCVCVCVCVKERPQIEVRADKEAQVGRMNKKHVLV